MTHQTQDEKSLKQTAKGAAAELGGELRKRSRQAVSDARTAGAEFADERKNDSARYLRDLIDAAGKGVEELDRRGRSRTAALVGRALDGANGVTDRVEVRSTSELWSDLEDFARRRPAVTFGAAFLVGFSATRFLKSSGDRAESRDGEGAGDATRSAAHDDSFARQTAE